MLVEAVVGDEAVAAVVPEEVEVLVEAVGSHRQLDVLPARRHGQALLRPGPALPLRGQVLREVLDPALQSPALDLAGLLPVRVPAARLGLVVAAGLAQVVAISPAVPAPRPAS